ncbi:BZ3501_MvSof-1269-A2-R1_Chr6-2g08519 [Microbotryum saponariae]|nr:BZ3501_MvSof-1269-A2-R1_Chr6-2g08519 [Microbotryum saponariae]
MDETVAQAVPPAPDLTAPQAEASTMTQTSLSDGSVNLPLSDKAMGKRKDPDQDHVHVESNPATRLSSPHLMATREKRVTRSSLGGYGASNGVHGAEGLRSGAMSRQGSEASAAEGRSDILVIDPSYLNRGWEADTTYVTPSKTGLNRPHLPLATRILLTSSMPSDVVHFPPLKTDLGWSFGEEPCPIPTITPLPDSVPSYRLLDRAGDTSLGRSRHVTGPETDTSDAHYQRLHRFPEVLEKRSARVERDRLIHERSKLILELEELKGRGWVYIGAQGGKGEEERRRKIKEGELRLARYVSLCLRVQVLCAKSNSSELLSIHRYDALLPNQPRKSNVLVQQDPTSSTTHAKGTSAAVTAETSHDKPSSSSTARPKPSALVSASGDGSTTIKLKFGGGNLTSSMTNTKSNGHARSRKSTRSELTTDDEASVTESKPLPKPNGSGGGVGSRGDGTTVYKKRDRAAEHARALERQRLGLPIKGPMSDLIQAREAQAQAQQAGTPPRTSSASTSTSTTTPRSHLAAAPATKRPEAVLTVSD